MTSDNSLSQRVDSSLMREATALKTMSDELQDISIQMLKKEELYLGTEAAIRSIFAKLGVNETDFRELDNVHQSVEPLANESQETSNLLSGGTKFVTYEMFQKIVASVAKVFLSEFRLKISPSETKLASRTKILHNCSVILPITHKSMISYLSFYWSNQFLEEVNASTMGELTRYFGGNSLIDNIAAQVSVEISMSAEIDVLPPQKPESMTDLKPLLAVVFTCDGGNKNSFEMYIH